MVRSAFAVVAPLLLVIAGCAVEEDPGPAESTGAATSGAADKTTSDGATVDGAAADNTVVTTSPPDGPAAAGVSAYGLALLATPAEATHLTVTDYDAIRARLGVPDLTSEDLMTDRLEFWRAAEASSVLLTDGLLREENSRYDLTYDFTQDDVDAEVRWTGPDGSGLLLALRPDLDLDLVQAAIDDDAPGLAEATLDRATSTVLQGAGAEGVWATSSHSATARVGDVAAESLIVRNGCVPFVDALGVDATVDDQDELLAAHDVEGLLEVDAVAIAFTGQRATVRLAYPVGTDRAAIEGDLAARLALAEDWPTTETIGFSDGFDRGSVAGVDLEIGEVQYAVTNPVAAANLALADLVPLGVCTDVELLAEPTGL
ncbi:hypothetical protein [Ornithinimicrobium cryptoxanthini]|uniref:Uncharacterized protein n=1 Tax=Ornithinimicrobium cryptoxanthini TaxID=2934161 RepID=A0ABY4YGP1_9MICO|nr:hypothetical protein [Ornithinimicrobium cryptoxanthini]USQ75939.1 hypothetical protein NF557_15275 [Ornithinimicrobium cryptoxanthini]